MSKRTTYIIVVAFYMVSLLCGIDSLISNELINNIRTDLQVILPILIIASLLKDQPKLLKENKKSLTFLIINILWIIITIIFGITKGIEVLKGFINITSILLLLYLLTNIKMGKERNTIIKHILIAGLICSVYGIIQYVFKINLDVLSNAKYPGILGRVNGTFYLATLYDKYMVLMFTFAAYNVYKNNSKSYMTLFILSGINVILTFARAGLLSLMIVNFIFIVLVLVSKQYKKLLLPCLLIIVSFLIPGFKYSLQSTLDYIDDKLPIKLNIKLVDNLVDSTGVDIKDINKDLSLQYRRMYEDVGKEFIKEYPLTGIGVNNYSYLYRNQNASLYLKDTSSLEKLEEYMYPHNGYIQLGAEIGITGLILYLGYIIYLAISYMMSSKSKYKYFSIILLIVFLLGLETETLIHNKQYIFLFAIIYSLYNNRYIKEK